MLGILLVDKPQGISSHDAVYRVRRALGVRKIGHSGTLDPLATGLLVMAVGDATRFLRFLVTDPKSYVGTARLGVSTTTQDSEGEPVDAHPIGRIGADDVKEACSKFVGNIQQTPPMYSAVKVQGERLYKLARMGVEVDRSPRQVEIVAYECLNYADGDLEFQVTCSAGTYVRTLVHDVGEHLGVGAHMTSLRRISAGRFDVAAAVPPASATSEHLLSLEDSLEPMPMVTLPHHLVDRVKNGNEFHLGDDIVGVNLGLIDDEGLYAVAAKIADSIWRPLRVLPSRKK